MESGSVLNCFKGFINRMTALIESIQANFDLRWNLVFCNSFISETMTIRWNVIDSDNFTCYSKAINSIFSRFHGFGILFGLGKEQHHGYQTFFSMIQLWFHQYSIKRKIIILYYT